MITGQDEDVVTDNYIITLVSSKKNNRKMLSIRRKDSSNLYSEISSYIKCYLLVEDQLKFPIRIKSSFSSRKMC